LTKHKLIVQGTSFLSFSNFFSQKHLTESGGHICDWSADGTWALDRSLPNILWFSFWLCDLSCGSVGIEDFGRHRTTQSKNRFPEKKKNLSVFILLQHSQSSP